MNEIMTSTERAGTAEAEPRLTLTELHTLLRDAAALERASRPIYMQPAAQPAPEPHPGTDVTIPGPAAPAATFTVDRPRNIWPLVFMVSGCTGLAACGTAAATGSEYAILAFLVAVGAWGTATYQLVFNRKG
jgi:hypothetical protein